MHDLVELHLRHRRYGVWVSLTFILASSLASSLSSSPSFSSPSPLYLLLSLIPPLMMDWSIQFENFGKSLHLFVTQYLHSEIQCLLMMHDLLILHIVSGHWTRYCWTRQVSLVWWKNRRYQSHADWRKWTPFPHHRHGRMWRSSANPATFSSDT